MIYGFGVVCFLLGVLNALSCNWVNCHETGAAYFIQCSVSNSGRCGVYK